MFEPVSESQPPGRNDRRIDPEPRCWNSKSLPALREAISSILSERTTHHAPPQSARTESIEFEAKGLCGCRSRTCRSCRGPKALVRAVVRQEHDGVQRDRVRESWDVPAEYKYTESFSHCVAHDST